MANINSLTKRKQIALLVATVIGLSVAVGTGWYASTFSIKNEVATKRANKEPAPDMTGVVNTTFDDKVQRNAITETQTTNKEIRKEMDTLRKELGLISRDRKGDQGRINELEDMNKTLQSQLDAFSNAPSDEPSPSIATVPQNGNVPPPTQFYPGMGATPQGQTTFTPMAPMQKPGTIDSTPFTFEEVSTKPKLPYIPSGSYAESLVIEGADANAAVTGAQNMSPMQFRLTGKVQMPNDREYDLTGCFVNAAAYGDVSSERAEVRTRSISCHLGDDIIDQKIAGHVSFMGKNGIKGQVVMRNGKILGWAFGAGFVDGIGKGIEQAASPQVGIGATARMGAADIGQAGLGGGASQAAKTLSEYYIKRAEQYHPVIPIGAGNEVTVVFQDGFQLESIEEVRNKKAKKTQQQQQPPEEKFSTPNMMNQLKDLKVGDLVHPSQE
ncbi:F-type conjugal transfer pilus assembly protein TraB [Yersinia sp. Marseille-Q3913]|uniref:F-type conjugal transfer pilus assembly protein TraB n=1 Tax=Yersinia TaxID=629 RepID=UPI001BB0440C|nr:F-type conjugal transfer pilus assembly protein TraB [Yersinia sp. Marseille-Q3913]